MATVVVAEGPNLEELEVTAKGFGKKIKHDAIFEIIIQTPAWAPIAPVFDAFGAEKIAAPIYAKTKGILMDVSAEGWYKVVLTMKANAFHLTPAVLAGLASVLIATGIVVALVKIEAPEEALQSLVSLAQYAVIGLVVVSVMAVAFVAYKNARALGIAK